MPSLLRLSLSLSLSLSLFLSLTVFMWLVEGRVFRLIRTLPLFLWFSLFISQENVHRLAEEERRLAQSQRHSRCCRALLERHPEVHSSHAVAVAVSGYPVLYREVLRDRLERK